MSTVRDMIAKLTSFKVTHWGASSSEMVEGKDREVSADLNEAHVTSSLIKDAPKDDDDLLSIFGGAARHKVVIDIDHQAFLVESTTPGHYHLYVDIPPCADKAYFDWLKASAAIGLIEDGYAMVSIERGHSDVRLPWVRKQVPVDAPVVMPIPSEEDPS